MIKEELFGPQYEVCISVPDEFEQICFSVIINNTDIDFVVGRSPKQQLVLLQCNSSDLFHSGSEVWANSSNGEIKPGTNVPHNTIVQLSCNNINFQLDGVNETRCVNGTFNPVVTNTTQCGTRGEIIMASYV